MFHLHFLKPKQHCSREEYGVPNNIPQKRCVTENTQRLFDKYAEPIDEAPKSSLQLSTFASHDSFVVAWSIGGAINTFEQEFFFEKLIRTKLKEDSK